MTEARGAAGFGHYQGALQAPTGLQEDVVDCGLKEGKECGGPYLRLRPAGGSREATGGTVANFRPWRWDLELGPDLEGTLVEKGLGWDW